MVLRMRLLGVVTLTGALLLLFVSSDADVGDDQASDCLRISRSARPLWADDIQGAAFAPDDYRGVHRWYYASQSGGVWISGHDPRTGDNEVGAQSPVLDGGDGGGTFPLNRQARAESDIGVDVPRDGLAFEAADIDSDAAQAALDCATGPPLRSSS